MLYRQDIDGLRALAVLLVVIFHAFPNLLPNGFLGVDIFFVISGFLITSILLHNLDQQKFSFINFYIRRVKRIFPIAILVLLFVAGVGILTLNDSEFKGLKPYLRSAAGFYINFQLLKDAGYFDIRSTYKPLLHYWSLAIEEQFYVVWPLLLFFMYKTISLFNNSKIKIANLLLCAAVLLLLASLAYFFNQPPDQYFSSLVRAWELLVGCTSAIICFRINYSPNGQKRLENLGAPLTLLSLILIFASQFSLPGKVSTLISVLGAALYLISKDELKAKSLFKTKIMVFVGLISYSLYLWHWPLLSFYRIYKPNLSDFETIVLVIFAFLLSSITYRFIEEPLKKQNWDLITSKFSVGRSALILCKLAFCIAPALLILKYSPRFVKPADVTFNRLDFREDETLGLKDDCLLNSAQRKDFDLTWCFTDSKIKKYNGLLFGDSHAHALYKGLVTTDSDITWQLVAKHSCPPFNVNNGNPGCRQIVKLALDKLKKEKNIHYLIFIMSRRIYTENQENFQDLEMSKNFVPEFSSNQNAIQSLSYEQRIIQDLKAIQSNGTRIIFIRPVPEIADNIYACTSQRFSFYKVFDSEDVCKVNLSDWVKTSKSHNEFIDRVKSQIPNLVVVDPLTEICDDNSCYAARDGKSLYEDKDHLSFHGSQVVARKINLAITTASR